MSPNRRWIVGACTPAARGTAVSFITHTTERDTEACCGEIVSLVGERRVAIDPLGGPATLLVAAQLGLCRGPRRRLGLRREGYVVLLDPRRARAAAWSSGPEGVAEDCRSWTSRCRLPAIKMHNPPTASSPRGRRTGGLPSTPSVNVVVGYRSRNPLLCQARHQPCGRARH